MSVWSTIPVDEQPELTLIQWRIFELPDGKRHFNGYVQENSEGRVSSTIIEFDPDSMRGRTRSGRVYQLAGAQGFSIDADYVLNRWLALNKEDRKSVKFLSLELL